MDVFARYVEYSYRLFFPKPCLLQVTSTSRDDLTARFDEMDREGSENVLDTSQALDSSQEVVEEVLETALLQGSVLQPAEVGSVPLPTFREFFSQFCWQSSLHALTMLQEVAAEVVEDVSSSGTVELAASCGRADINSLLGEMETMALATEEEID